jgi:hypothetical protein
MTDRVSRDRLYQVWHELPQLGAKAKATSSRSPSSRAGTA